MKILDLSQKIVNFEGESIPRSSTNKDDTLLKHVLLTYIRSANSMGIKEHERTIIFELGSRISNTKGKIELSQGEYDSLKRLADDGKTEGSTQQKGQYIFSIEISEQVKKMINAAEDVLDGKDETEKEKVKDQKGENNES